MLMAAVGLVAGCYFKYKRNNHHFLSSIKYLHARSGKDKDSDLAELVPEISFSNPGFQEEIDQEVSSHKAEAFTEWWRKLLDRSRRSIDSAFMGSDPSSEGDGDAEKAEATDFQLDSSDSVHLLG